MTTLTWVHLSDLHFNGMESPADMIHLEKMLDDVKAQCDQKHLTPDAIFLTGDLAFSGQKKQYDFAGKWFEKLLAACGLPGQRDRLFIVPGNHDIDRTVVGKADWQYQYYRTFAADLLNSKKPYKEVDDFLGDDEHKEWAFRKFRNFEWFISEFFGSAHPAKLDFSRYYSVREIKKDDYTVVVLGLNSAWLSFRDDEQGQLLLGARQVCDAANEQKDRWPDARLRIALVHHPLYWMAEKDIHEVQKYLPLTCDLLLRGHLHCSSFTVQSTPDSHLHEFAAGASHHADYRAYSLTQLNLETGQLTASVRLQVPSIGPNWSADSFTYRKAKNGMIRFRLALAKHSPVVEV